MRHRVAHRKLGRTSSHRRALLRNLCTSLVLDEQIVTTVAKAKELRPFAEKAITLARRGQSQGVTPEQALHARRLAACYFIGGHAEQRERPFKNAGLRVTPATGGVAALDKLFDTLGPRFADRKGGYTRIIKLGFRHGDGAEMAVIELVGSETAAAGKKEAQAGEKKGKAGGKKEVKAAAGKKGEKTVEKAKT